MPKLSSKQRQYLQVKWAIKQLKLLNIEEKPLEKTQEELLSDVEKAIVEGPDLAVVVKSRPHTTQISSKHRQQNLDSLHELMDELDKPKVKIRPSFPIGPRQLKLKKANLNGQDLITDAIQEIKSSQTLKDLLQEYDAKEEMVDFIPIVFKDNLDVSARTENGIIYLNDGLKEKVDEIPGYLLHEICHVLQQCFSEGPTEGSDDDSYLDNEFEIEGFQNQNKFLAETEGKDVAECYTSKVLDHHDIEGDERKKKRRELLQLAMHKY